jgi:benzil reductase ((S)-benzoin forming)
MTENTKTAIVTGTSRGIGLALARVLLDRDWRVLGLARRFAPIVDDRYTHLTADLGDLGSLQALAREHLVPALTRPGLQRVAVINNAAMIGSLSWLRAADPQHLG